MAQRIRGHDWASTPLGSIDTWPAELKSAVFYLIDSATPVALVWGPGLVTLYNDGFRPILGNKPDPLGRSFRDIWSEVWTEIGPLVERAFAGQSTSIVDYPLLVKRSDAVEQAYFTFSYTPVRAADGTVLGMLDTVWETTASVLARKQLEESEARARTLIAELQHRTRNLMGIIRSMASKAGHVDGPSRNKRARFLSRLDALARTQGLLSRLHGHDRVTFDELVHSELSAVRADTGQVELTGPKGIRLRSSMVQAVAMALHELASNALQHGALSRAGGRLKVTWSLQQQAGDGTPWLHIDWREQGVALPAAAVPAAGTGQGRALIEQALPYQVGARTQYTLRADGVHCRIAIPVSETTVRADGPQADGPQAHADASKHHANDRPDQTKMS